MNLYVHESDTARRRDLRLATLPSRFEQMLDGLVELPAFDLRRLEGTVSRVKEMCDELAGYGLPEIIQHDDSTTARCSYAMAARDVRAREGRRVGGAHPGGPTPRTTRLGGAWESR